MTNLGDQTVAVIDGKTNAKIASVSASSSAIDVNPVSRLVYTSDPADGLVHVISEQEVGSIRCRRDSAIAAADLSCWLTRIP